MEKQIEVSIIVPVYNAESYLKKCITSLTNQDYNGLEIILINDGSKDNSADICNSFAQKYENVIFINQENRGVSAARNHGIQVSNGEWITFMDSDDWADNNYINMLLSGVNDDVALVQTGFQLDEMGKQFPIEKNGVLSVGEACTEMFHTYCGLLYNVWGKLFRADIIKSKSLAFKNVYREDGLFVAEYLRSIGNGKVHFVSKSPPLHYRTSTPSSLSKKKQNYQYMADSLMFFYTELSAVNDVVARYDMAITMASVLKSISSMPLKTWISSIRPFLSLIEKSVYPSHYRYNPSKLYYLGKVCPILYCAAYRFRSIFKIAFR